jgi:hypothetical protein
MRASDGARLRVAGELELPLCSLRHIWTYAQDRVIRYGIGWDTRTVNGSDNVYWWTSVNGEVRLLRRLHPVPGNGVTSSEVHVSFRLRVRDSMPDSSRLLPCGYFP